MYKYPFKPGQHVQGTEEGSLSGMTADRKIYVIRQEDPLNWHSTICMEPFVLSKQVGSSPAGTHGATVMSCITDNLEIVPGSTDNNVEAVHILHSEVLRLYNILIDRSPTESLTRISEWLTLPEFTPEQIPELLPQMYAENRRLSGFLFWHMPIGTSKPFTPKS